MNHNKRKNNADNNNDTDNVDNIDNIDNINLKLTKASLYNHFTHTKTFIYNGATYIITMTYTVTEYGYSLYILCSNHTHNITVYERALNMSKIPDCDSYLYTHCCNDYCEPNTTLEDVYNAFMKINYISNNYVGKQNIFTIDLSQDCLIMSIFKNPNYDHYERQTTDLVYDSKSDCNVTNDAANIWFRIKLIGKR
jgi:hypothetical protein